MTLMLSVNSHGESRLNQGPGIRTSFKFEKSGAQNMQESLLISLYFHASTQECAEGECNLQINIVESLLNQTRVL